MVGDPVEQAIEVVAAPWVPGRRVDLDRSVGLSEQLGAPGGEMTSEFDEVLDREVDLGSTVAGAHPFEERIGFGMQEDEDVDARASFDQSAHLVEDAETIVRVLEELGERERSATR